MRDSLQQSGRRQHILDALPNRNPLLLNNRQSRARTTKSPLKLHSLQYSVILASTLHLTTNKYEDSTRIRTARTLSVCCLTKQTQNYKVIQAKSEGSFAVSWSNCTKHFLMSIKVSLIPAIENTLLNQTVLSTRM
jgi:hypothetical protein